MRMRGNVWIYIAVMAGVSFAVRALPLTLIRKRIQNRFLRSFPTTLSVVSSTVSRASTRNVVSMAFSWVLPVSSTISIWN